MPVHPYASSVQGEVEGDHRSKVNGQRSTVKGNLAAALTFDYTHAQTPGELWIEAHSRSTRTS